MRIFLWPRATVIHVHNNQLRNSRSFPRPPAPPRPPPLETSLKQNPRHPVNSTANREQMGKHLKGQPALQE